MNVIKRGGSPEPFDKQKIINALEKAFVAANEDIDVDVLADIADDVDVWEGIHIEEILLRWRRLFLVL